MEKVALEFRDNYKYPDVFDDLQDDGSVDIHDMVCRLFYSLDMDSENYGTRVWNPLGKYVSPGDNVVIKPNLVLHKNYCSRYKNNIECVHTNVSIVKEIIDFTIVALKGEGRIVVGDAPVQECDFDFLVEKSGYRKLINSYKDKGINIELIDFRGVRSVSDYGVLHQFENENEKGVIVNLGDISEFADEDTEKISRVRITNFDPNELVKHHNEEIHEYCVSSHILEANVVINVPKPKTHRKAGMTACLKNLVGINCRKEYLPHHTKGSIEEGGDEYRRKNAIKQIQSNFHDKFCLSVGNENYFRARFYQILILCCDILVNNFVSDKSSFGSWCGNRTISRTIIDLNKIIKYADKDGNMTNTVQRKIFNIADMIVSGEHNGPMAPEPKNVGLIVAGENSYACDYVIAKLMGARISDIPSLNIDDNSSYPLFDNIKNNEENILVVSNDERWNNKSAQGLSDNYFSFVSPDNWESAFFSSEL